MAGPSAQRDEQDFTPGLTREVFGQWPLVHLMLQSQPGYQADHQRFQNDGVGQAPTRFQRWMDHLSPPRPGDGDDEDEGEDEDEDEDEEMDVDEGPQPIPDSSWDQRSDNDDEHRMDSHDYSMLRETLARGAARSTGWGIDTMPSQHQQYHVPGTTPQVPVDRQTWAELFEGIPDAFDDDILSSQPAMQNFVNVSPALPRRNAGTPNEWADTSFQKSRWSDFSANEQRLIRERFKDLYNGVLGRDDFQIISPVWLGAKTNLLIHIPKLGIFTFIPAKRPAPHLRQLEQADLDAFFDFDPFWEDVDRLTRFIIQTTALLFPMDLERALKRMVVHQHAYLVGLVLEARANVEDFVQIQIDPAAQAPAQAQAGPSSSSGTATLDPFSGYEEPTIDQPPSAMIDEWMGFEKLVWERIWRDVLITIQRFFLIGYFGHPELVLAALQNFTVDGLIQILEFIDENGNIRPDVPFNGRPVFIVLTILFYSSSSDISLRGNHLGNLEALAQFIPQVVWLQAATLAHLALQYIVDSGCLDLWTMQTAPRFKTLKKNLFAVVFAAYRDHRWTRLTSPPYHRYLPMITRHTLESAAAGDDCLFEQATSYSPAVTIGNIQVSSRSVLGFQPLRSVNFRVREADGFTDLDIDPDLLKNAPYTEVPIAGVSKSTASLMDVEEYIGRGFYKGTTP
ncbi:hypothetical protein Hypma_009519 [Hypsizygus marmoreus]|uniref:Uncharacterized protein n=1 Tax=Hypsizygus marmoreus TaxID=39966 RepID=A0A369JWC4_HYPMA|nr:hypothetical protein Hypma_009519 [Hypsizygus marmoreus]